VVLAERPDVVNTAVMQTLPPNPRSLVDAIKSGDTTFADAGGPAAYFGFPADATAVEGRHIVEALGAILEEAVMEVWTQVRRSSSRR
jgi:creatinine amidohydrolase